MNKKENKRVIKARRSFIMSVLSFVLCIAMLIGSTFAWFTDSVTSGKNRIIAGNLDIEMYYKNRTMNDWKNVTTADSTDPNFFVDKNGQEILWEPGVVSYATFEVRNVGNLALKYQFYLEYTQNYLKNHGLSEVVKAAIVKNPEGEYVTEADVAGLTFADINSFTMSGELQVANSNVGTHTSDYTKDTFAIVLYWKPNDNSTDNLYNVNNDQRVSDYTGDTNNYLWLDMDIRLTATQLTSEYDAFDNQYDAEAAIKNDSTTKTPSSDNSATFTVGVAPTDDTSTQTTTVEFPSGNSTLDSDKEYELKAEVKNTIAANESTYDGYTISDPNGGFVAALDITLTDITDATNPTEVHQFQTGDSATITTYIAKNLNLSANSGSIEYTGNDELADQNATFVLYDPETGKLVFTITHLSNYVVITDDASYISETNTAYATLQEGINASTNGQTVYLLKDITNTNPVLLNKDDSIIINLGGKKITGTEDCDPVVRVVKGNYTLKNGTIESGSYCDGFDVYGSSSADAENYTTLTIAKDLTVNASYGVYIIGNRVANDEGRVIFGTTVNVYGKFISKPFKDEDSGETYVGCAFFIDGNIANSESTAGQMVGKQNIPTVNIYDGAELGEFDMNGYCIVNISGGTITAGTALAVKKGHVNIAGGTLHATGPMYDPTDAQFSGSEESGAALGVTSTYNKYTQIYINITGGTLISDQGNAVFIGHSQKDGQSIPYVKGIDLSIGSGSFQGASGQKNINIAEKLTEEEGIPYPVAENYNQYN